MKELYDNTKKPVQCGDDTKDILILVEISDGGEKKKLLRQARFFDSYDDGDIKIIFAEMTEIIF